MVADMVVQLFAAIVVFGLIGLLFIIFLNRRQEEELERSYNDPASFRSALHVHLRNRLGRVEQNINATVKNTVKNVVDTVRKLQPRQPVPVMHSSSHGSINSTAMISSGSVSGSAKDERGQDKKLGQRSNGSRKEVQAYLSHRRAKSRINPLATAPRKRAP